MSLVPGTTLGPYEIVAPLGAGGMGEVYRARDTNLNRDVAIKVLLPAVANDPDRLARFSREAQVLASLNHTNIAHIYGLEDAEGVKALVLELVEGEDLAQRVARGPIPIEEALPIARQIAEALEAAHEQAIIHRDLKPANIKVRADGTVKVLDFGLAKAMEPAGGSSANAMNSPTLSMHATQAGVILGTAAYMSPEQARGKAVDRRTDIWAFGCVLFELLTGARAFPGDDVTDTMVSVVSKDPNWDALPSTIPPGIRMLLRRSLEKDSKRRLDSAAAIRIEIDDALTTSFVAERSSARSLAHSRSVGGMSAAQWTVVAGVLMVGLLLIFKPTLPSRNASTSAPLRLSADLGVDAKLSWNNSGAAAILSPDGALLAFIAQKAGERPQLFVRRLDQLQAAPRHGTDDATSPFFSPDSQWIAFFADGKMKKVPVSGGAVVPVCDAPAGRGGAWAEDGTIFFSPAIGVAVPLMRVSSTGGTPEHATTLDQGEVTHRFPQVLPGGNALLYMAHNSTGTYESANLVVQRLPSGTRKVVVRGGYYGRYLPSGHLIYMHEGTLFAVPFDIDQLQVTGPAVPVIEGVTSGPGAGAQYDVSGNGTLVYVPGQNLDGNAPIDWASREGKTVPLRSTRTNWSNIAFAPDGRRLAMDIFEGGFGDIWVYEWARDAPTRLTFDPSDDQKPVWTPDSRRIAFASKRGNGATSNLYWQRADGTGEVQRLTEGMNAQFPSSWHPSGKFLAFHEQNPRTGWDLMILPMDGSEATGWKPGKATVFLNTPFVEYEPMFSPDGRWLAYQSNESGRQEIYVRPFPGPGSKWQVSTGGGTGGTTVPTWSRTRRELFYNNADRQIMVVPYVVHGDSFQPEKPRLLSPAHFTARLRNTPYRSFDLHPDGERFALGNDQDAPPEGNQGKVVFIFNFFDELRRIAPTRKR